MREVDRLMIDDFHINLLQMMENAGRNLAELSLGAFAPAGVLVLAGRGGNGGGGLVAARHLANRGVPVTVALSHDEANLAPVPLTNSTFSPGWTSLSSTNPSAPTSSLT